MFQVIPSFYAKYSENSLFLSANTQKKDIVRDEYTTAHHNAGMRFLLNCSFHISLLGKVDELLQKLDPFYFK